MKKFVNLLIFSFIIFVISAIVVGEAMREGSIFGPAISRIIVDIANTPVTLKEVASGQPPAYLKPADFEVINKLEKDLYALHTYQETDEAVLVNLKNNQIIHRWQLKEVKPAPYYRYKAVMLPNRELIYYVEYWDYLAKIDSNSNVVWEQKGKLNYHHSIVYDGAGGIWIGTKPAKYNYWQLDTFYYNREVLYPYAEDFVTHIDARTGEVIYTKSLMDMYLENGLNPVLTSYTSDIQGDIFHLNDVEPVKENTAHMNKGDLLISVRNQKSIVHYRPATGQIIKTWHAGIHNQHDIDIIHDTILSVFNNNAPVGPEGHLVANTSHASGQGIYSQNVLFTYEGQLLQNPLNEVFYQHSIFSPTEGLVEYLPSGRVFVEEQNDFNIWVFQDTQVLYKGYFSLFNEEGYKEIPNWTQVYEDIDF